MSIDQQLRDTVPTQLPSLDHETLQRRGRRRRLMTRAGAAATTLGVIAVVASLAVPSPFGTGVEVAEQPPTGAGSSGSPDAAMGSGEPDAETVRSWGGLTHEQAVTRLHGVLDEHPARPDGLESIEVHEFADGHHEITTVPEGKTDFAVVDVADPRFVVDGQFEASALLATWDQAAARKALDSLAATKRFRYERVAVDPRGRTVLEFDAAAVDQQVWVDPASGYTVGTRYGDTVAATEPELDEGTEQTTRDVPVNPEPTTSADHP